MNRERLLLEGLLALALAWFSIALGNANADEVERCGRGLPALSDTAAPADTEFSEPAEGCRSPERPADWMLKLH